MSWNRAETDENIRAVRALRDELADRLPAESLRFVDQMLDVDEPNEALVQIAWTIAEARIDVPDRVFRFIEDTVGSRGDLPVDPTGRSGPPVSRRSAYWSTEPYPPS